MGSLRPELLFGVGVWAVLAAAQAGCFPGPVGDEDGAPCNAHGQCASGLVCDGEVCRSETRRECAADELLECELPTKHGICRNGSRRCEAGMWGSCRAPAPEAELCDGLDNNCNGEADEMDVLFQLAGGAVYLDPNGRPADVGAPCFGRGACRLDQAGEASPGSVVCVTAPAEHPAGLHTCCDVEPGCPDADSPGRGQAESCDGVDNDCDGTVDEDCPL